MYLLTNSPEIRSSTPSECKRSSTVLDIIGGPRQNGLATKNSLGSLGLPAFFLFPKIGRFLGALLEWVPLRIYPPKFGRRLCEKILRICSQIPPKFDLLTFAHTAFAHFTTYLSVVHYNKPLGLFMCKHLSDRAAYL